MINNQTYEDEFEDYELEEPNFFEKACEVYGIESIRRDIARHKGWPLDVITDEQIQTVQMRGWSINEDGEPYCLRCGLGISCSLELMLNRKFCGVCRFALN